MSDNAFDVIVIGGGEAGIAAVLRATELGAKALLINREPELGGGCVQTGTLPSKTLGNAAHFLENLKKGKRYGVPVVENAKADYKAILDSRHKTTMCELGVLATLLRRNAIATLTGDSRLQEPARGRGPPPRRHGARHRGAPDHHRHGLPPHRPARPALRREDRHHPRRAHGARRRPGPLPHRRGRGRRLRDGLHLPLARLRGRRRREGRPGPPRPGPRGRGPHHPRVQEAGHPARRLGRPRAHRDRPRPRAARCGPSSAPARRSKPTGS